MRLTTVLVSIALLLFFAPSWEAMLVLLLFYLYGSIPYATIVSRKLVGKKIEQEGSGSVGVANSYMNAGMLAGSLTVAGEVSKGLLPLFISFLFFDYSVLASVLFLSASLLGTNFSILNRLLGGMGTTMVMWSLLIISPFSLVGILLVLFASYFLIKDTYWMTVVTYASGPLVIYLVDGRWPLVGLGLFAAVIYLLKFRRSMDEFELSK
ncbi:MAG: glycerol-3-phosphate acyltransferase, partial [Methanomassiliicoccales archaeon]|nr:glycerol-3-phosphate acyltransferase [Methanomassiliicoccales archaeon]